MHCITEGAVKISALLTACFLGDVFLENSETLPGV